MRKRIAPGPGQESVWDYPRPPRVETSKKQIQIVAAGVTIADTQAAFRILETSHPPVYYLPPDDIRMDLLLPSSQGSFCEWKGHAHYFSLSVDGRETPDVAWCYRTPTDRFEVIAGCLAFYPSKVDECLVDGERVQAQEGDFYGGWITRDIVGPFKGGPGTWGW